MNSVVDAMFLHNQLLGEPPTIDEKLVNVSYHKSSQQAEERNNTAHSAAANAAMAAAQWSHQGQKPTGESQLSLQGPYSEEDIERLAEYSASTYAKNETEKETYLEYYRNYYRNGGTMDGTTSSSTPDMPTEGGQVRHPSEASKGASLGTVLVDGIEYKRYGTPDVSTYVYDETSGYYYDATTTLYYDATSQYYFNSKTNQYMYWSNEHETYLPAPDGKEGADQDTDKKGDKKDKVKTAKRIAKDMEKWAKTLNQRKEAAKSNQVTATPQSTPVGVTKINISSAKNVLYDPNVGAEDIAFSMLNKMDSNGASVNQSTIHSAREPCLDHNGEPPPPGSRSLVFEPGLTGLASYNSDSDEESKGTGGGEEKLTDWTKLACLLCQRQFPSKEKLTKHNQLSDLHKQNLDQWRSRQGSSNGDSETDGLQYRDRAKERRAKFGEADQPKPNKLKEKYMRAMQDVETKALPEKNIGSDNIGSKMLQRMGWKEGLGLGKSNQGRTDIVEAEQRTQKAGLGSSGPVRSNPNDSYKDCVKRTMYQRYHQLDG
jgi:RNA-binding protein 5/10